VRLTLGRPHDTRERQARFRIRRHKLWRKTPQEHCALLQRRRWPLYCILSQRKRGQAHISMESCPAPSCQLPRPAPRLRLTSLPGHPLDAGEKPRVPERLALIERHPYIADGFGVELPRHDESIFERLSIIRSGENVVCPLLVRIPLEPRLVLARSGGASRRTRRATAAQAYSGVLQQPQEAVQV
jgi:hypothetical protein